MLFSALSQVFKCVTPETKVFGLGPGAKSMDMTSALCPWNDWRTCPDSTSQRAQVASPLPVRTWLSDPGKRQQDM